MLCCVIYENFFNNSNRWPTSFPGSSRFFKMAADGEKTHFELIKLKRLRDMAFARVFSRCHLEYREGPGYEVDRWLETDLL